MASQREMDFQWSHGLLFREAHATAEEVRFRYPTLRETALHFLGIVLCLAGLAAWNFLRRNGADLVFIAFGGLFTLLLSIAGVRRAWEQRAVIIRPVDRILSFHRKTPFGRSIQTLPFSDLDRVTLEQPLDSDSENLREVRVRTTSGRSIFLGTANSDAATNHARRYSELLGNPLGTGSRHS